MSDISLPQNKKYFLRAKLTLEKKKINPHITKCGNYTSSKFVQSLHTLTKKCLSVEEGIAFFYGAPSQDIKRDQADRYTITRSRADPQDGSMVHGGAPAQQGMPACVHIGMVQVP